ncbi:MAG: type IV pilus assembly protein PilM [Nitrospirae bacterium]|nr:type IV pilus assembly protein PilM [Nitrospirota bacterium]
MFFSKKKETIGIDIGSSSIKVIQLTESEGRYTLNKFGLDALAPEIIVDGTVMDSVRCVETLQNLISAHDIRTKDAVISVSGHSVIVKRVTLPQMSEDELSESIKWEAEQYIPFDINEVNMDFQILSTFTGPDGKLQMNVLLAAVKKDKLADYTSLIIEAGLTPAIVDIDAFAIENMYNINYEMNENDTVALVNIGAGITNINILQGGMFAFTRDISIGGNRYTESIQKDLGLSFEDAEKIKKGESVEGAETLQVDSIIENVSTEITSEITRSFGYFKATMLSEKINKVLLSGGSSKIPNLDSFLQERLELPVELINPFKMIDIPPSFDKEYIKMIAPFAAVAVGLGVRRMDDR